MIEPVFTDRGVVVYGGDCLDVLRTLPGESVHAIVTDPPYGLSEIRPADVVDAVTAWCAGDREHIPARLTHGFMGRDWDRFVPPPAVWDECLRVLTPGGHLVAFAGSRTYDLMGLSIRLAGFEIRDGLQWIYGSGFPKGQDVGKALSKVAADANTVQTIKLWLADRFAESGKSRARINRECGFTASDYLKTEPGNDAGGRATWHLLLPYGEKWARLREVVGFDGTYDDEIEKYGQVVGRNNDQAKASRGIYGDYGGVVDYAATDAARQWDGWNTALKPAVEPMVLARKPLSGTVAATVIEHGTGAINIGACRVGSESRVNAAGNKPGGASYNMSVVGMPQDVEGREASGRWPANVLLDEHAAAELDAQSGTLTSGKMQPTHTTAERAVYGQNADGGYTTMETYGDTGGASRFFPTFRYQAKAPKAERPKVDGVAHPTVKPLALMRWLVRLLTPPGGTILDPFAGSGTTLQAARDEGFASIGVEREPEYLPLIRARLQHDTREMRPAAPAAVSEQYGQTDLFEFSAEESA